MTRNSQVIFASVCPQGSPAPGDHLQVRESTIDLDAPLADGAFLVKQLYFSLDPYFRMGLWDQSPKIWGFRLGEVVRGSTLGVVVRSSNSKFAQGDIITSAFAKGPFAEYVVVGAPEAGDYTVLPQAKTLGLPLSNYLSVLGVPGLTAYYGMIKYGEFKAGNTLYVSAATGGVGQVVGQIGKQLGLRVIGSTGSDDKVEYLKKIGYDDAFNYKKSDIATTLGELCPDGIDVVFENVAGNSLNAAMVHCNNWTSIILCGASGHASSGGALPNLPLAMAKRLKIQAINAFDATPELVEEFKQKVAEWLVQGKIKYREAITEGIENTSNAVTEMLVGDKFGKPILKVADL